MTKREAIIQITLAEIMKEKNISQAQLAKDINERRATIHDMFHNKSKQIPLKVLAKVCAYLEVDIGDILKLEYLDSDKK